MAKNVTSATGSKATKSEVVKNVESLINACTNKMFDESGRLKEVFVFKAHYVADDTNYLRGDKARFSFVIDVDDDIRDEFSKVLDRMGVEKAMVKGQMPTGREMYVTFDRGERRPFSVPDFDELVELRQAGTDEEVEAIDRIMDLKAVSEILKEWNAAHPRQAANAPAPKPASRRTRWF